ncbi:MAG: hypothetical protein PHF67_00105 [Candidatus Nanoarchaeia archaeon]|nr:hypothetical protein [Candidatus Nanoarchaeia archaeon]
MTADRKKFQVLINEKKAIELSQRLFQMMDERVPPYDREGVFPDAIVPEGMEIGGLEHRLFLFYSGSIDGRTSSPQVYQELRDLSANAVNGIQLLLKIVDPETIKLKLYGPLESYLLQYLPKTLGASEESERIAEVADNIKFNSRLLLERYSGDPKNILVPDSVEETHLRLCRFKGIGRHKGALIMKNYVKFGVWPFNEYEIPMKVDRHTFRILYGTGVMEITRDGEPLEDGEQISTKFSFGPVQDQLRGITSRNRISAIKFNDGLWSLGSRSCRRNDYVFCQVNCYVGCYSRPNTPESVSYLIVGSDTRKNRMQGVLF